MSFMDIFSRPQKVLPDSDFAYLTTAIVVYQHDEEFAEPGMPDPVVPVLSGRTSEQASGYDIRPDVGDCSERSKTPNAAIEPRR